MDVGGSTNWVEMVAVAVVFLFLVYGVVKGFMLQLAGILVLIGSLVLASILSPMLGELIRTKVFKDLSEPTAKGASFIIILLVGLGVGRALSHLLKGVLEKAKLLAYDRLLGGVIGAIKGALIIMILVIGSANFFYDEDARPGGLMTDVIESRSAWVTKKTAENLRVLLPPDLAKTFDKYAKKLP